MRWSVSTLAAVVAHLLLTVFTVSSSHAASDHLRFGIIVGGNPEERQAMEPVRDYLERALDLPVDLFLMEDMGQLAAALSLGDIDFARLSSSAFAAANAGCGCLVPLVSATPDAMSESYYSVLLTRKLDAVSSLADLKGKRLGLGPETSIALHKLPLAAFREIGIEPTTYFLERKTYDQSDMGLKALLSGEVDALAGWSTLVGPPDEGYSSGTLKALHQQWPERLSEVDIDWRSAPIPYNVYAVGPHVTPKSVERLQAILEALQKDQPELYRLLEPKAAGGLKSLEPSLYQTLDVLYTSSSSQGLRQTLPTE